MAGRTVSTSEHAKAAKRLGLDTQSLFGMPATDHVTLAASLGCGHVSISLTPLPWKLSEFPDWSLRDDAAMRRELMLILADTGVVITQGDGFSVRPGKDVNDLAADLDIFASLGARAVGGVCMERDMPRAYDQLGRLAELAGQRGMNLNLEFAPPHAIPDFAAALAAVEMLGRANMRLIIDTMHFFRSGSDLAALGACDPARIAYAQISDVPAKPLSDNYFDEACFERRMPGDGELPLKALLAALPPQIPLGIEVPIRTRVNGPQSLPGLMREAVDATIELVAQSGRS